MVDGGETTLKVCKYLYQLTVDKVITVLRAAATSEGNCAATPHKSNTTLVFLTPQLATHARTRRLKC